MNSLSPVVFKRNPSLAADACSAETAAKDHRLERQEIEIISLIVSGYSNLQIAQKLSINEGKVKHCVTCIYSKLGMVNRLELVLFVIHRGLLRTHSGQTKSKERTVA